MAKSGFYENPVFLQNICYQKILENTWHWKLRYDYLTENLILKKNLGFKDLELSPKLRNFFSQ